MEPLKADEMLMAANELRLLVFVECEPESCGVEEHPDKRHFHQVYLTSEQFKKISDATCNSIKKDATLKDGFEICEQQLSESSFDAAPFEGLNSIEY